MKRKNKPTLAIEHARELQGKIEWEGDLLYVVNNWGNSYIKEFRDKKFTSLVKALRKAAQDLETYCFLERVEDEQIEAEEQHEADKVDESCPKCGDTLDDDGVCGTCGD
jgi:hypothetical protein